MASIAVPGITEVRSGLSKLSVAASPETVTVCSVPPFVRRGIRVVGCPICTMTLFSTSVPKPAAITVTVYVPGSTRGSTKLPPPSAVTVFSASVASLWIVTVAFPITAPVRSSTVPLIAPWLVDWPMIEPEAMAMIARHSVASLIFIVNLLDIDPPEHSHSVGFLTLRCGSFDSSASPGLRSPWLLNLAHTSHPDSSG